MQRAYPIFFFHFLTVIALFMPALVSADSILVDTPKGKLIRLVKQGAPQCGTLDWGSVRRSGYFSMYGKQHEIKEAKLPLSRTQWEKLLGKVAGASQEITIAHDWDKAPAGLAAALRVAYDIRSHGGHAWVLNGSIGKQKPNSLCQGNYVFKGKETPVYLADEFFWKYIKTARFLDARGQGADAPPSYTWVTGSPQGAKAIDIASFMHNGKVDKDSYSCDIFDGYDVAGCDSLHKTYLLVEAAKYANCKSQPKLMPYWGLAGASRDPATAKHLWGEHLVLNSKRSGNWTDH